MLQNLGLKGDTMGLGMCVKFGIKQDFGSGDMGLNGVSNGAFTSISS